MGIWDRFSGRKTENGRKEGTVAWKGLTQEGQLDAIVGDSFERAQVIFKHSRTCGISSMARRRFENTAEAHKDRVGFHLLVIQDHRELSNEISRRFQVRHESPQLLVLVNGTVVRHASHWQIEGVSLETYE